MSLSVDTVFQVVEVVQKAVEIYQRIRDAPDTVRKLGRRMERLETILENLEKHLRSKKKHALARLRQSQTDDLLRIIDDTREDCDKVYALFDKWEKKSGPLGLQFRDHPLAQYAAQAYFALGSSVKDLEALAGDIDVHRRDINDYMGLMGVQGLQANQDAIQDLKKTLQDLLDAKGSPAVPAQPPSPQPPKVTGDHRKDKDKAEDKPRPRPSPSPSPLRKDFKLIFIDPHNLGRSVCAEALMALYREWTNKSGGDWRIKTVHSAGFFTRNQSDSESVINSLDYKYDSYKMEMAKGGLRPNETAIAAVFDNKNFEQMGSYKKKLQTRMEARVSRGIKKDVFNTYDYILVFTGREHDNMIKLRSALVATGEQDAVPKGKGRVLHLGQYLTLDGIPREIVDPPKNSDGTHSRDAWNWKTSQLKIAIRGFLKKEMEWKQPKKKEAT
ncbi:hypothetical protein BJ170DRAFT_88744 [Xylariales sp. AK1849]|nr:hypothetical protein BJ170DRAFT_88744 [Xylariales sp. AK1849]